MTQRRRGPRQPVKPGAGQDRAGCFQAGQAGNDALTEHGPPGEQVASHVGAGRPHTPPDLGDLPPLSDSSREHQPPLEKNDRCPDGQRFMFRRPDGRLVAREQPCDRRACPVCGPRLRQRWVGEWSHAMAGDQVHRLVVTEAEWVKLRRQKAMAGQQWATVPQLGGVRVVYTTAELGEPVRRDASSLLASDFAAMPTGRNRSMSKGWLAVIADLHTEAEAAREPWECLGRVGRSLEHVAMVAEELGLFVGRTPDMVILERPDPAVEARLFALVRLQRGRRRREAAA
jgi:hypothetical protein